VCEGCILRSEQGPGGGLIRVGILSVEVSPYLSPSGEDPYLSTDLILVMSEWPGPKWPPEGPTPTVSSSRVLWASGSAAEVARISA
jgi:hypothetical protein